MLVTSSLYETRNGGGGVDGCWHSQRGQGGRQSLKKTTAVHRANKSCFELENFAIHCHATIPSTKPPRAYHGFTCIQSVNFWGVREGQIWVPQLLGCGYCISHTVYHIISREWMWWRGTEDMRTITFTRVLRCPTLFVAFTACQIWWMAYCKYQISFSLDLTNKCTKLNFNRVFVTASTWELTALLKIPKFDKGTIYGEGRKE